MRFVNLIMLSDFMQGLNSTRKYYTKNEYFLMLILFSTIYLLHEQKLKYKNYSVRGIIMGNFVQATEYAVHMYASFEDLILHGFL
jgi:hypothetical protein